MRERRRRVVSGVAKQLGAKESVGEIFTGILTRLGVQWWGVWKSSWNWPLSKENSKLGMVECSMKDVFYQLRRWHYQTPPFFLFQTHLLWNSHPFSIPYGGTAINNLIIVIFEKALGRDDYWLMLYSLFIMRISIWLINIHIQSMPKTL